MDKLRLSLMGPDFARLYSGKSGFNGGRENISFPSNRPLLLMFVAQRQYQVTIEGDATIVLDDEMDERYGRLFSVNWADSAKRNAAGTATLTIVNPDMPEQPFVFALSLGAFAYQPVMLARQPVVELEHGAEVAQMLLTEQHHSWFGDIVTSGCWQELLGGTAPGIAGATGLIAQ